MTEAIRKPAKHPHINAAEVALKYAEDAANNRIVVGKLVQYLSLIHICFIRVCAKWFGLKVPAK